MTLSHGRGCDTYLTFLSSPCYHQLNLILRGKPTVYSALPPSSSYLLFKSPIARDTRKEIRHCSYITALRTLLLFTPSSNTSPGKIDTGTNTCISFFSLKGRDRCWLGSGLAWLLLALFAYQALPPPSKLSYLQALGEMRFGHCT